jgi:nucleotide-binding universal stress UspA family protein
MGVIVAGVDGSADSVAALRFAIDEARLRGDGVRAIHAWHVPPNAYGFGWSIPVDVTSFERIAEATLERALDEAGASESGVTVTSRVRNGQPAEMLCREAEAAVMLVVGSRGLGGFTGLLLGSVSQACVHHAPCPVVVLPHKPHD